MATSAPTRITPIAVLITIAAIATTAQPRAADLTPREFRAHISAAALAGVSMPRRVAVVAAEDTDLNLRLKPRIEAALRAVGVESDDDSDVRLEFRTRIKSLPEWRPPFTITSADPMNRRNNKPAIQVPIPDFSDRPRRSLADYAIRLTLTEPGRPVLWQGVAEASTSSYAPYQVISHMLPVILASYGKTIDQQITVLP